MPSYQRPDVYTEETLSPVLRGVATVSPTGAFVGTSIKGPTTPTRVRSWSQYQTLFGGFITDAAKFSWLPFAVYTYFNNGGGPCYVTRVVGSGAVNSSRTLQDRAGSPLNTLTVTAFSPGVWGDSLYVKVVDRDAPNGRFDLVVLNGGASDDKIVERWTDVTMNPTDTRYVVNVVNSLTRGSAYITVSDLNSATVAPNDTPAAGTFQLASGADGSAPISNEITAAIDLFDQVTTPIILNLPGVYNSTIINAALQYAAGRRDTFVVVDPQQDRTVNEVTTYRNSLTATSFGALYYPWPTIVDPSVNRVGVTRDVPPGGAIAGLMVSTDRQVGPHKAPAGIGVRVANAVSLERVLTLDDLDTLATSGVNALRPGPNSGINVMGARTLANSGSDTFVPVRRTLIYLRDSLTRLTQFAVFEPNDATLWSAITDRLEKFLHDFYNIGGLRGNKPEEAFFVKCDDEVNTLATIEAGEVHVQVGVALQYPAEFVIISIAQWEGGNAAEEVL